MNEVVTSSVLGFAQHPEGHDPTPVISQVEIQVKDARIQRWLDAQPKLLDHGFEGLSRRVRERVHLNLSLRMPLIPSTFSPEIRRRFIEVAFPEKYSTPPAGTDYKFNADEVNGLTGRLLRWVKELRRWKVTEPFDMGVKRTLCIREYEALEALFDARGQRFLYADDWDPERMNFSDCKYTDILEVLRSVPIDRAAVEFVDRCIFMALAERADTEYLAREFLEEASNIQGFLIKSEPDRQQKKLGGAITREGRLEAKDLRQKSYEELLAKFDGDARIAHKYLLGSMPRHLWVKKFPERTNEPHNIAEKEFARLFPKLKFTKSGGIRTAAEEFKEFAEERGLWHKE